MTTPQSQQKTIIQLYPDGDQWCALVGVNIVEGTVGFGDTPFAAVQGLKTRIDRYHWKNAIVQFEAPLLDQYDLFADQALAEGVVAVPPIDFCSVTDTGV